jgi:hypothetical protein
VTQGKQTKQRTLDWRNRRSWLGSIRFYAGELLDPGVRRHLERKRPKCCSADLSWLPDHEELVPAFCAKLASYYSHAKTFHGCRLENIRSYYEHGLQGHQAADRIQARFRELFHDVAPDHLQKAIDEQGSRDTSEKGKIWLWFQAKVFQGSQESEAVPSGHTRTLGRRY